MGIDLIMTHIGGFWYFISTLFLFAFGGWIYSMFIRSLAQMIIRGQMKTRKLEMGHGDESDLQNE